MVEVLPRVLIVEDQKILAETLALALGLNGFKRVQVVDDLTVEGVNRLAAEFKPEVALLDLHLDEAGMSLPMIAPLVGHGARVLVLTPIRHRTDLLAECLEAGASGLFDKADTFDHLIALIRDAALGVTVLEPSARQALLAALRERRAKDKAQLNSLSRLTPRERQVLQLLTEGKSAEEIATDQFVTMATIRSQIRAVLQKLGVNSQLAAVALARRVGWELIDR
jgi:two-component system, NarL family, nitrate/nitrite response regulator NarL